MSTLKTKLENILQDKLTNLIPENLRRGINCLGVQGALEPAIQNGTKLFSSEEEMQNDPSAVEGDLAVVYSSSIQNGAAQTEFTQINFPDNVVLPSAITSSSYCMMRSDTGMGYGQVELNASRFRFSYYGIDMIRVSYTSIDGINYTKTEGDNIVTFEEPIKCYMEEEWNDNMGYFMQTGGYNFDGLFQYGWYTDEDNIWFADLNSLSFDYDNNTISNIICANKYLKELSISTIDTIISNIESTIIENVHPHYYLISLRNDGQLIIWTCYDTRDGQGYREAFSMNNHAYDSNKNYLGISSPYTYNYIQLHYWEIDENTLMPKQNSPIILEPKLNIIKDRTVYDLKIKSIPYECGISSNLNNYSIGNQYIECGTSSQSTRQSIDSAVSNQKPIYKDYMKYILAPTQFTLKSENELLPGKKALGKNGIIEGNDSLYDNLNTTKIIDYLFQIKNLDYSFCEIDRIQSDNIVPYKLYGLRFDENGKYGLSCASNRIEKTFDITNITGNYLGYSGYICIYNNKLYIFSYNSSGNTYTRNCSIYNINDDYNFTYIKTITWTDKNTSVSSTSALHTCKDGKVYEVINKGYGSGGTGIELHIFDLDTETVSSKTYKQITSSSVYGVNTYQIDVDNTSIYISAWPSNGSGLTSNTYVYNWTLGTITTLNYRIFGYNQYENNSIHNTYTYFCDPADSNGQTYNRINIFNKKTRTVVLTIETTPCWGIPNWYIKDDIAYLYSNKYVCKLNLNTLEYIINEINLNQGTTVISIPNKYIRSNKIMITDDTNNIVSFLIDTSTNGDNSSIYQLNLNDLTCKRIKQVNKATAFSILLYNGIYFRQLSLKSNGTINNKYYDDIIRESSIDDFGNGVLGLIRKKGNYTMGISSDIPNIRDILMIGK